MSSPSPQALLIIVCCHSIFHGTSIHEPSHWNLAPFQQASENTCKPAENITFLGHIRAALQLYLDATLQQDVEEDDKRRALVVFSGGRTSSLFPELSEAASYLNAAIRLIKENGDESLEALMSQPRESWAVLEEYATDSYQNVLFSILRYRKECGSYPSQIVVVTHAFKEERIRMHADAIAWSRGFEVHGMDPQFGDEERTKVIESERVNARDLFKSDPYGAHSLLRDKRLARRWSDDVIDRIAASHSESVARLLRWTGGENGHERFLDGLPWNQPFTSTT